MKRPGVRLYPSVCPSVCPNRSTATTPGGGFADERPAANDFGPQLWTPALSSKRRGQRHFDSRRGRLNTDYLDATSTRLRWPTPQIKIADILQLGRKCAATIGTVLAPSAGRFQC